MFTVGDILTWEFHVLTDYAVADDGLAHIKYEYWDATKKTVGLLSQDIALQECQNGGCVTVPEPSTLLLLGTGLAAVGIRRRRQTK